MYKIISDEMKWNTYLKNYSISILKTLKGAFQLQKNIVFKDQCITFLNTRYIDFIVLVA